MMPRTTKEPAERRKEFIRTAQALFNEKGYENTSVDDIVNRMKVAKGLFYYYFDTKEDLLNLILDQYMDKQKAIIDRLIQDKDLTATQLFMEWMRASAEQKRLEARIMFYIHEERNRDIHTRLERKGIPIMLPIVEQIIRLGLEEGIFDCKHPSETAVAFLGMLGSVGHLPVDPKDHRAFAERVEVIQYLSEKLLGAEEGTLDLYWEIMPKEIRRHRKGGKR